MKPRVKPQDSATAGGTAFGFEFSGGRSFVVFRRGGGFGFSLRLLTLS